MSFAIKSKNTDQSKTIPISSHERYCYVHSHNKNSNSLTHNFSNVLIFLYFLTPYCITFWMSVYITVFKKLKTNNLNEQFCCTHLECIFK